MDLCLSTKTSRFVLEWLFPTYVSVSRQTNPPESFLNCFENDCMPAVLCMSLIDFSELLPDIMLTKGVYLPNQNENLNNHKRYL